MTTGEKLELVLRKAGVDTSHRVAVTTQVIAPGKTDEDEPTLEDITHEYQAWPDGKAPYEFTVVDKGMDKGKRRLTIEPGNGDRYAATADTIDGAVEVMAKRLGVMFEG
jgi:hypothetical protein